MAVTNYYSFGGEILGEETGGVRRDYLTDALGSVTATVTGAGTVENTYRYKPYGETLAKTGIGGDPKYLWNGKWGYRKRSISLLESYVRARSYSNLWGSWTTSDKIGYIDGINLYSYVRNAVTSFYDRSGNQRNDSNGKLKPSCNPDNKIGDVLILVRGGRGGCGADATDAVKNELDKVRNGFQKLTKEQQIAKCAGLLDSRTRSTAWDITPLNRYEGKDPACGQSSECEFSVTISIGGNKTCHCAGFINYTLFGMMFGLCRDANVCLDLPYRGKFCFSIADMGFIIAGWKIWAYQDFYGSSEGDYWAKKGHSNDFPGNGPSSPGSKMCCTPCNKKTGPFNHVWTPATPPFDFRAF